MNASRVHSVVAAGVENPKLLELWQREPHRLREYGIDPDALDLNALWKFAGLTAKVRHNGLRADFPLTFRLMNVAGLEIEVFAAYASFRAGQGGRYADTPEARAQELSDFLEHWLELERPDHAMLWDLMWFELALSRLSLLPGGRPSESPLESRSHSTPRTEDVPRVEGQIILHEMRCDIRKMAAILQEKSPRLGEVALGTFYFGFWRRSALAEVHILELDELGFYLLALIDGKRSVSDLSRLITGRRQPRKGLVNALGELAAVGTLTFDVLVEAA